MSIRRKGIILICIGLVFLLALIGATTSVMVALQTAAFMGTMGFIGSGLFLLYSQVGK